MMHGSNFMRGYGYGMMYNSPNGWMALISLGLHLLFFIILVLLAVFFLRRHGGKMVLLKKQNDPALKILRERYALGEIDSEEYQLRYHDLTN
ncbi:putative membrane protein [Desulfosporosinus acidiphilus SJ4]|uniref:Putative membrane protein n=1 Tax=Desulfosporosinus acidiphilus (strain DSM 22704 / JCM 16185 / SJ4) TaxID=646529 RepID=I4D5W8_DESAJ|nr:SHOCT domain-containing protein [Desulfosporosinus acidiphilus]AFM41192.1 putative membrane protein [Desulfosporosinus acidiphilus SJ4]